MRRVDNARAGGILGDEVAVAVGRVDEVHKRWRASQAL